MAFEERRSINRVMTSISVYMALLDLGINDFEKIRQKLYDYYGRTISDCYNHPEYLKEVLEELYGNNYHEIVRSIKRYLGKEIKKESINEFLGVLSEKDPPQNQAQN